MFWLTPRVALPVENDSVRIQPSINGDDPVVNCFAYTKTYSILLHCVSQRTSMIDKNAFSLTTYCERSVLKTNYWGHVLAQIDQWL